MSIKAITGKGVNRAKVICDGCRREDTVTADYLRRGTDWAVNEGQVKKKIAAHGWADVKGKLFCPKCELERKVVSMRAVKDQTAKPDAPREATRKQRIEIITMLAEVYDLDAQRYTGGDTDDTVAEVLGVMPGWVAQIRDAEFGPAGNEDIEALKVEMAEWRDRADASIGDAIRAVDQCKKDFAKVAEYQDRLAKIERAVGQRVMVRAGVKP